MYDWRGLIGDMDESIKNFTLITKATLGSIQPNVLLGICSKCYVCCPVVRQHFLRLFLKLDYILQVITLYRM